MSNPLFKKLGALTVATVMAFTSGSALAASLDETNAQVTQGAITAVVTEPIDTAKYEEAALFFLRGEKASNFVNDLCDEHATNEQIDLYASVLLFLYQMNAYTHNEKICGNDKCIAFTAQEALSIVAGWDTSAWHYLCVFGNNNSPNSSNEIKNGIDSFCDKLCDYLTNAIEPAPLSLLTSVDDSLIKKIQEMGGTNDAETKIMTKSELDTTQKMLELLANLNRERLNPEKRIDRADSLVACLYESYVNDDEHTYVFQKVRKSILDAFLRRATEEEKCIQGETEKAQKETKIETSDGKTYFVSPNGTKTFIDTDFDELRQLESFHYHNVAAGMEASDKIVEILVYGNRVDLSIRFINAKTDNDYNEIFELIENDDCLIDSEEYPGKLNELRKAVEEYNQEISKPTKYTKMEQDLELLVPDMIQDVQSLEESNTLSNSGFIGKITASIDGNQRSARIMGIKRDGTSRKVT